MTGPLRRVAVVLLSLIGVLAAGLTMQVSVAGSRYSDDPRNVRAAALPHDPRLGEIITADGVVVAEDRDDRRSYPRGSIYFHPVGVDAGEARLGLAVTRESDLRSLDDGSITAWLIRLFGGSVEPPQVRLTIRDSLQSVAAAALEGKVGAVVALDPKTGAILAYASSPSLDPNLLITAEMSPADALSDPGYLDRSTLRLLPSGSTFKVLVAVAALEAGLEPSSLLTDGTEYLAPGSGQPIGNAGGGDCGTGDRITLEEALVVSCNTAFARLAVDLGGNAINGIAERAGFNSIIPFELGAAISSIPSAVDLDADLPALAQTALGERDVRVTPLQMAMVAAALGNDGVIMKPYLVEAVITQDGSTLESTRPESIGRLTDEQTARQVVTMMTAVVDRGTGLAARREDVAVAGKTGTAEGSGGPHAWFIAMMPAESPTIAVAVVVEGGGSGGSVAAPIAAQVFDAWLGGD